MSGRQIVWVAGGIVSPVRVLLKEGVELPVFDHHIYSLTLKFV